MYFNIPGFDALTWYFIGTPKRQTAVAYTSVSITLLFLLMVIAFHVYNFTILGSVIQKTRIFKELAANLVDNKKAKKRLTKILFSMSKSNKRCLLVLLRSLSPSWNMLNQRYTLN